MTTGRQALSDLQIDMGEYIEGDPDAWIDWTPAFGIQWPVPNVFGRYRVLPYHDLHHVITGYSTDGPGECEMGAWGLAAGEAPLIGRFFDLLTTTFGLVLFRERTLVAWRRGRACRALYGYPLTDLLDMDLGELRVLAGLEAGGA